jgi:hypothetical protein
LLPVDAIALIRVRRTYGFEKMAAKKTSLDETVDFLNNASINLLRKDHG